MATIAFGSSAASSSLRDRIFARADMVREGWGRWRIYRRTLEELSSLSNRDLADIGLNRSMISSVAMDAAYGKQG